MNRFDEHIKDQFLEYSPQVHPRLWENIIKEREKRRPVGFWINFFNSKNILLLSGLLLAVSAGTYFILHTNSKNTPFTNTTIAAAETQPQNNVKSTVPILNAAAENTAVSVTSPAAEATNNSGNNSNTTGFVNPAPAIASEYAGKKKLAIRNAAATEDMEATTTGKVKTSRISTKTKWYKSNAADFIPVTESPDESNLAAFYFVASKNSTAAKTLLLHQRLLSNINLPGCPSIEKDAAGNKRYVEIYGGPDLALRSFSDTGNSAYLQKRRESTSFSSAYSAGLRYTQVFNNGMSIRTGINFSQINEKFTYVQGNLVQITYIINANGDTTGTYVTTGTRYKTTHNKFRTIDIPLVMGYEMGNGRIHANVNAGIIINAYSWQKGEVLDTALHPVNISTGKSNSPYQFKTNIGLGFLAGVSFYYKLNEKAHLLAEPYFRYNLTPMSKENLTFKQKYNTAGLRLGLRIDL
jgi:hypothetical protein